MRSRLNYMYFNHYRLFSLLCSMQWGLFSTCCSQLSANSPFWWCYVPSQTSFQLSFMKKVPHLAFRACKKQQQHNSAQQSDRRGKKGAEPSGRLTSTYSQPMPTIFVVLFHNSAYLSSHSGSCLHVSCYFRPRMLCRRQRDCSVDSFGLTLVGVSAEERNEIFLHTSR